MSQPLGLVLIGGVAVALIAGTFTLLALGRPVPEPVWIAWGVVVTALFGHGTFLAANASHQETIGTLLEGVRTGATAAATTPTAGNSGLHRGGMVGTEHEGQPGA